MKFLFNNLVLLEVILISFPGKVIAKINQRRQHNELLIFDLGIINK